MTFIIKDKIMKDKHFSVQVNQQLWAEIPVEKSIRAQCVKSWRSVSRSPICLWVLEAL